MATKPVNNQNSIVFIDPAVILGGRKLFKYLMRKGNSYILCGIFQFTIMLLYFLEITSFFDNLPTNRLIYNSQKI